MNSRTERGSITARSCESIDARINSLGEFSSLADKISENKREMAKKARKIIVISECTKKDLIRLFGIPPEKISVVHLATSMGSVISDAPQLSLEAALPKRYILFVGTRNVYKNFYFFINSMRLLMKADLTLHIFFVPVNLLLKMKKYFLKIMALLTESITMRLAT